MFGNVLAHVKHADLFFAFKDSGQSGVGIDHPFVFGVLKVVLLNVIPHLFDDFSSRASGAVRPDTGAVRRADQRYCGRQDGCKRRTGTDDDKSRR